MGNEACERPVHAAVKHQAAAAWERLRESTQEKNLIRVKLTSRRFTDGGGGDLDLRKNSLPVNEGRLSHDSWLDFSVSESSWCIRRYAGRGGTGGSVVVDG